MVISYLQMLSEAYAEPLSSERLRVYVLALSDLPADKLTLAFNRAVRELKFWPRPAELRELATGTTARGELQSAVDAHWAWLMRYLQTFFKRGVSRTTPRLELGGKVFLTNTWPTEQQGKAALENPSGDHLLRMTVPPKQMPPLIQATLVQMSGTLPLGLSRLAATIHNPALAGEQIAFMRRDFDAPATRYLAALSASRPNRIDPSHQLEDGSSGGLPEYRVKEFYVRLSEGKYRPVKWAACPDCRGCGRQTVLPTGSINAVVIPCGCGAKDHF